MKQTTFDWFRIIFLILGGFAVLFILAPIVGLFVSSNFPELKAVINDKEVSDSIITTLYSAMLATFASSIFVIPAAYFISRNDFFIKRILISLFDLPVVIPHTAAGIAILGIVSRNTTLGNVSQMFGIDFIGSHAGIALAMAFVSIPFLFNAALTGFDSIPRKYELAALNLGASPLKVFFTISLPLAWRAIVGGIVLMFARGMSEFGAVIIIAYHPMTTPILIFERFTTYGLAHSRPVAILFISISLFIFFLFRLVKPKSK